MSKELTVIIPVFNSSKTILRCLMSLERQIYTDFDVVIVDDASFDDSLALINDFNRNTSLSMIILANKTNSGVAVARNRAMAMTNSDFIAFLDSDDYWLDDKLSRQMKFMKESRAMLTYTSYFRCNSERDTYPGRKVNVPDSVDYYRLLKTCDLGTSTVIVHRSVLPEHGMRLWRSRQDYIMWLEIAKTGVVFQGINEPLVHYEIGGEGISRNKLNVAKVQWRVYRRVLNMGLINALWHFMNYAYFGFRKY